MSSRLPSTSKRPLAIGLVRRRFWVDPLGGGLSMVKWVPTCAGEFGTTYVTGDDINWIHDFTEYINNVGSAADGRHNNIASWFYW